MRTLATAGLVAFALLAAACGGSQKESKSPASTSGTTSARADVAPEPKNDTAKTTLKRSAAKATVQQGLGAFLQKVTVDDKPVFLGGKFHGWRITALKGDLSGIELRPGDVGFPPTTAQYEASVRLVRFIAEQHQVPLDREHILGHCEADPGTTHTNCPIGAWDWDLYMQLLCDGF